MNNEKHNGYTNYATWRVNLEIFDGFSAMDDEKVTAEYCEEYAEEVIFSDLENDQSLACSYARAFLADVNWHEIAEDSGADETNHKTQPMKPKNSQIASAYILACSIVGSGILILIALLLDL